MNKSLLKSLYEAVKDYHRTVQDHSSLPYRPSRLVVILCRLIRELVRCTPRAVKSSRPLPNLRLTPDLLYSPDDRSRRTNLQRSEPRKTSRTYCLSLYMGPTESIDL